jgi:hypothetical protein
MKFSVINLMPLFFCQYGFNINYQLNYKKKDLRQSFKNNG